jgi:hypothetical protein
MGMFASKDQRIVELEKKVAQMEQSFAAFRSVIEKMQNENADIRRDRDFLMERYKNVLRQLEKPLMPVKDAITDTSDLVRDIMLEGLSVDEKSIDDLFELVMRNRKIKTKKAVTVLKLSEDRVRSLAEKLKKQGLIDVTSDFSELRKK